MLFFLPFRRSVENGRRNLAEMLIPQNDAFKDGRELHQYKHEIHNSGEETLGKSLKFMSICLEPPSVRMKGIINAVFH